MISARASAGMLLRASWVNFSWRPSGMTKVSMAFAVCFAAASWTLLEHLRNSVARLWSVARQRRQQQAQSAQILSACHNHCLLTAADPVTSDNQRLHLQRGGVTRLPHVSFSQRNHSKQSTVTASANANWAEQACMTVAIARPHVHTPASHTCQRIHSSTLNTYVVPTQLLVQVLLCLHLLQVMLQLHDSSLGGTDLSTGCHQCLLVLASFLQGERGRR